MRIIIIYIVGVHDLFFNINIRLINENIFLFMNPPPKLKNVFMYMYHVRVHCTAKTARFIKRNHIRTIEHFVNISFMFILQ